MDYEAQACMEQTCAPVFQHFKTVQFGSFCLNVSEQSSHRKRMLEVYVRYTLGESLGKHRPIHTQWISPQVLCVEVRTCSDDVSACNGAS